MALAQILADFKTSVADGLSYIVMAHSQDAAGHYVHPEKTRQFISESAFLKIFIGWEEFLEKSFLDFMMGELSTAGNIVATFVSPPDIQHARKLVVGTQKFVDWSNPEIVRRLSMLYFDQGHPFDPFIASINQDLMDMRTIRNSSAHLSSTTIQQLDALGSRKLNRPCSNIKVPDLILALDPASTSGSTILDNYLALLDIAAVGIANA